MTDKPKKRTAATLKAMVTRRDKRIAKLEQENLDARRALADAVRFAKQMARENTMLKHNMEVLQRPHRVAKRNELSRRAVEAIEAIRPHIGKIDSVLKGLP